ncbi:MAG: Ig-like domain-containing protein [Clostridia bacterium]|nr:Ig-like domain-containing protein [Clostridia bacterium]
MKRKIFSVLLSVAMVMVMMPSMAFAAEGETAGGVPPESTAPANPSEGTTTEEPVAKVGEISYATLVEAVSAVSDGGTVELLRDCDVNDVNNVWKVEKKNVVLDLNGKNVSSGSDIVVSNGGKLTVKDTKGTGALVITGIDTSNGGHCIIVDGTSTEFVQESGKIEVKAANGCITGYGIYCRNGGTATIKGGEFNAIDAVLTGNNTTGEMNFNVEGGTLTSSRGPAIYMPGQVNLTMSGGTLNGGVSLRMGQVNISGGTINSIKDGIDSPSKYYNYSGSAWFPDAFYVIGGTYANGNDANGNSLNLNITGGTFNCLNDQGSAVAIYDLGRIAQTMNVKISGDAKLNTQSKVRNAFDVVAFKDLNVKDDTYGKANFIGKVSTEITGGTFSSDVSKYVAKDYFCFKHTESEFLVAKPSVKDIDGKDCYGGKATLDLHETAQMNFEPGNEYVKWSSADGKTVQISEDGKLEAIGTGEVVLSAKAAKDKIVGIQEGTVMQNFTIIVKAPYVPSTPSTPPEKTETSTETKPNGDQVTTTTTTNTATGAVTEKVETVKPDGTKSEVTTETKTDKKADGTVVQKEDKTVVETGKDGKKTETKVEKETTTRPDGTATETTTTTNADKSKEIVEKETSKNDFDNKVTEETTTTVSATGEKTVEQTTKIDTQQVGTITVDVQRDAEGKVTDATAEYAKNGKDVKGGTKVYLNGNHAKQIGEALGDDVESVEVTVTIKTESGENSFTITAQTKDLKADKELYIVAVDKDGNQTLVNATTYKTSSAGSISAVLDDGSNYQIITKEEKDALVKAIKDTIAPKAKVKAVTAGKTSKIALKNTLNRANVKSITYKTSKRSVATVSKNGTIIGKKAGKATISATVTLKDGSKKTVKMTVTVKAKKYNK